jgi:hypothetical protein
MRQLWEKCSELFQSHKKITAFLTPARVLVLESGPRDPVPEMGRICRA